jgi:hypothetical protein
MKRETIRAASAAAVTVVALGLTGSIAAAPAAFADDVVTPIYGMSCATTAWATSGTGTCTGAGKWRVAVDCAWSPFDDTSVWLVNGPGETQSTTVGNCTFGVNAVTIEEKSGL